MCIQTYKCMHICVITYLYIYIHAYIIIFSFFLQVSAAESGEVGHSLKRREGGASLHHRALRQGGGRFSKALQIQNLEGVGFRVFDSGFRTYSLFFVKSRAQTFGFRGFTGLSFGIRGSNLVWRIQGFETGSRFRV